MKTGIKFYFNDLTDFRICPIKELILKGIHCDILDDNNTLIMWSTNGDYQIHRGDCICTLSLFEMNQTRLPYYELIDNTERKHRMLRFQTYDYFEINNHYFD